MGSSTADKHHATSNKQQAHSTKRKEPPADHTPPKAKKGAAPVRKSDHSKASDDAQQALRERHRQAVSALYIAYEQLSGTGKGEDSDAAAYNTLLEGAKGYRNDQQHCVKLILRVQARRHQIKQTVWLCMGVCCPWHAVRQPCDAWHWAQCMHWRSACLTGGLRHAGGTCAQRVAARLIPRFAHRFPQKLEQAAAALIAITGSHSSTKDPDGVRALSKVRVPGTHIYGPLAELCQYLSEANMRAASTTVLNVARINMLGGAARGTAWLGKGLRGRQWCRLISWWRSCHKSR